MLSVTDQKQLVYPTSYYIALGTNIGNYRNNLSKALVELGKIGHVTKVAHIYKSKPYGYLKQNFFYNSMVCLKSENICKYWYHLRWEKKKAITQSYFKF